MASESNQKIVEEQRRLIAIEQIYLNGREIQWPFIKLLRSGSSNTRHAYDATALSIARSVAKHKQSDVYFLEQIEYALSFIFDANDYFSQSLRQGFNDENRADFWATIYFSIDEIGKIERLHPNIPVNLKSFEPVVRQYIDNPIIQSSLVDSIFIQYMALTQILALSRSHILVELDRRDVGLSGFLFGAKSKLKGALKEQIDCVYDIYLKSSPGIFDPSKIYPLVQNIGSKIELERIFLDLLESQVARGAE